MADSFLDGNLSLDAFIESYQSKRILAHLRRVKIEKLQEILLKCVQTQPTSGNEHVQPQTTSTSAPFDRLTNGSAVPLMAPLAASIYPTALHYPANPCIPVQIPSMVPSYSSPPMQEYTSALPSGPSLAPRAGFIIQ